MLSNFYEDIYINIRHHIRCLLWQSLLLYSSVYRAISGLSTVTTP